MRKTSRPQPSSSRQIRRPSAPIACAFACGILLDHVSCLSTLTWVLVLGGLLVVSLAVCAWPRLAGSLLLLATAAAGSAWHHHRILDVPSDDIGRWASSQRTLCRVEGRVFGDVMVSEPGAADRPLLSVKEPRSRFTLSVDRFETGEGWQLVQGRMSASVTGRISGLSSGDRVRILGWLASPRGPSNPGEFDYRAYLNSQGIRATLFTETPDAVERLPRSFSSDLWALRDRSRDALAGLLLRRLPPSDARVGEAFLLGVRSALPQEEIVPFIESGTVHVLVVSGLHVGLLAGMVWSALTILGFSLSRRALVTILAVGLYTYLTGANAPAVRAAVLIGLVFGGYWIHRGADPLNSLAASALVVLCLNPADLFQPGAQLSFLCAFALVTIIPSLLVSPPDDPPSTLVHRAGIGIVRWLANLVIVSSVLWLATAPLVMHSFHLWSPISILASLPLVVISGATLFFGVVFFILGWFPFVGPLVAMPLGWLLHRMTATSDWASSIEPLCRYVAGPPTWWVGGFYAIFIGPWLGRVIPPAGRAHRLAFLAWLAIGGAIELWPSGSTSPLYHQLAVGHGQAGVLRLPAGHTILFDCGAIGGPQVGERILAPMLWHDGVRRIDAVVISHADIDHFNGLVKLARRFRIERVIISPQFVRTTEPAATLILEELRRRGIAVRFAWRGDWIEASGVQIDFLHPPADFLGKTDNAASLVAKISHAGRSILITGDLADDGLQTMFKTPVRPVDVFVAPHHGSRASNNDRTAHWASPSVVVSSQADEARRDDPLVTYSHIGATVLRTNETGAVSVIWTGDQLRIQCHSGGRVLRVP